jgi:serine protease Do
MRHATSRIMLFIISVLLLTAGGWTIGSQAKAESTSVVGPILAPETKASPVDLTTVIMDVAKTRIPAVVHIEVTERQEVANPLLPFAQSPYFRHFFGLPKKMPKKLERKLIGIGSGIIMDPGGHILTNNHVVAGATKIIVTLSDGTRFPGMVMGTDPLSDLGVIKISSDKPLPYLTFGDSDKVEVGQWVVAIGQPEGLNESVTQGIISAKHRTGVSSPESYQDFLQTDAAINPGNSGGPLLSLQGEVIGVNSAIISESGGFMGIGFAIPSNMAVHIAKALIANGKVVRGWLGVSIQDLNTELAKKFGLSTARGALVADVMKNGPADKAGMKQGDVILAYQGKEIPNSSMLRNEVANTPVGQEAKVTVWRNDKKIDLTVTIGNLEDATKILMSGVKEKLGVEVESLTAQEAEKLGMQTAQGVVLTEVDPNGPLGKAGFEKGDIILQIDGRPVVNADSFAAMVNSLSAHQKIVLLAVDPKKGQAGYVHATVD